MKRNPTAEDSCWNISFWFAVSSPLLGVLLAFLALAVFCRWRSHEHNANHIRFDHSIVRFRFDRTAETPPEVQ